MQQKNRTHGTSARTKAMLTSKQVQNQQDSAHDSDVAGYASATGGIESPFEREYDDHLQPRELRNPSFDLSLEDAPAEQWRKPLNLPPVPDVAGWHFCWAYIGDNGKQFNRRYQQGYRPVTQEDARQMFGDRPISAPGFEPKQFEGMVFSMDHVLCKLPHRIWQSRKAQEAMAARRAEQDQHEKMLDNFDRQMSGLGRMRTLPGHGSFSNMGRGNVRRPRVAPDEGL